MALAIGVIVLAYISYLIAILRQAQRLQPAKTLPTISLNHSRNNITLICPCKDYNEKLKDNVQSLLHQKPFRYEIIFVIESDKSEAYKLIREEIRPFTHTRLLVSHTKPNLEHCGKIWNLLTGYTQVSQETEFVVFVDSGRQYPEDWLYLLVGSLSNSASAVASTTFFWSYPDSNLTSKVICWISNTFNIFRFLYPGSSFLWGGSMCFRKKYLDQVNLKNLWVHVVSDDLTLSSYLEKTHKSVLFVPQAAPSRHLKLNLSEGTFWLAKQLSAFRFYHHTLWKKIILEAFGLLILMLLPLILIIIQKPSAFAMVVIFWTGLVVIKSLCGIYIYSLTGHQLEWRDSASAIWLEAISLPLALVSFIYASVINKSVWAGTEYSLSSDGQIVKVVPL